MAKTFFFYDLETSGLDARRDRIMQFAGIRTDEKFNQIGEPVNLLVKITDDILPSPGALLVTGITPQQTLADGYSEAELCRTISEEVFTPDTTVVGFNSIRFDDEFIRHLFWRNFYDPYEWAYKDGRSRWDILDVARMTRALRPEGIEWPVDKDGKSTNKLTALSAANGLDHHKAHDALSDVEALLGVTRLISEKQPQLFNYLLKMRDKNEVKKLINLDVKQPFVYVSGRYDGTYNKATVAFPLTAGRNGNVIVYDLRHDPSSIIDMDKAAIAENIYASWETRRADDFVSLPVKELQYNRAPAVAPLGVLESENGWDKIAITKETVEKHKKILLSVPSFAENVRSVFEERPERKQPSDPELELYEGFLDDKDRLRAETVRNASEQDLADLYPDFTDSRLDTLLLRYKARNFPNSLSESETVAWEEWRSSKLMAELPTYVESLAALAANESDENKLFILQELQLWAESVVPVDLQ